MAETFEGNTLLHLVDRLRGFFIGRDEVLTSGGGVAVDHGTLSGLTDDDHAQYLLTNGGRTLSGNMLCQASVTIDGVDISAHAADANAHHAMATAGNTAISIAGQAVSVALATSSGLSIASGLKVDTGFAFTWTALHTFSLGATISAGQTLTTPAITATANLTINPTGDVTFDPAGNDILPATNYDLNLGSLGKKYLTLHAAELWVETLVAQETLATIGGRILVGPTTQLTSDLAAAATTMYVKHNNLSNGHIGYLEALGKVEFIRVASSPGGSGPYSYTIVRNVDGSGANNWYAGDAIFNTGTTGNGFIDLYSVRGVKAASQYGPTIVGNVRNSTTYNDWIEHWAIGNLNGIYGYGTNTYGFAAGKFANSATWVSVDATNGYRVNYGASSPVVLAQWDASGNILVGQTGASQSNVYITSGAVSLRNNTTTMVQLSAAGAILVGQTGASHSNIYITSGYVALRNNTTERIKLNADGSGFLASSNISWTTAGVATISGWTVGTAEITSGNMHVAAGAYVPASGQHAWIGVAPSAGYMGFNLSDGTRHIQALVNNGTRYPYLGFHDGTRWRVVLGGLNYNWGDGLTDGGYGMKVFDSSGNKLVELSGARNVIGGWTVGASTLSATGITLTGGATPYIDFTNPESTAYSGRIRWYTDGGELGGYIGNHELVTNQNTMAFVSTAEAGATKNCVIYMRAANNQGYDDSLLQAEIYANGDDTYRFNVLGKNAAGTSFSLIVSGYASTTEKYIQFPAATKTTTGHPATYGEGSLEINTYDNKIYMYADGSWRQLATW